MNIWILFRRIVIRIRFFYLFKGFLFFIVVTKYSFYLTKMLSEDSHFYMKILTKNSQFFKYVTWQMMEHQHRMLLQPLQWQNNWDHTSDLFISVRLSAQNGAMNAFTLLLESNVTSARLSGCLYVALFSSSVMVSVATIRPFSDTYNQHVCISLSLCKFGHIHVNVSLKNNYKY